MSTADIDEIVRHAYQLQRRGDLVAAEALYRHALHAHPRHSDCLHMLGVVCLRQEKYMQGVDYIEQACIAGGWRYRACFANLVRGLEQLVATLPESTNALAARQTLNADRAAGAAARRDDAAPLVSVLIPSFNHARFIRQALRSVFSQTYARLELVVIDDGSTDSSPNVIRDELSRCSMPHKFISRENRGAPATLNECVALASGRYINALNSDDLFTPTRIEEMVRAIHESGAEWGFSRCALIDNEGNLATDADHRAPKIRMHFAATEGSEAISHQFLLGNPVISSGNIFASRNLVHEIGGFSDYRYAHDWAFCLNASWYSEPVFVNAELYRYRLHDSNTISEANNAAAGEGYLILSRYCQRAETQTAMNPVALCKANHPARLSLVKLMHTRGEAKSSEHIRHLIQQIRDQYSLHSRRNGCI